MHEKDIRHGCICLGGSVLWVRAAQMGTQKGGSAEQALRAVERQDLADPATCALGAVEGTHSHRSLAFLSGRPCSEASWRTAQVSFP